MQRMKILDTVLILSIYSSSVGLGARIDSGGLTADTTAAPLYPSLKTLDSSFENIISKVQLIKAKIAKTLNETSSIRTRHESLVEEGYNFTTELGYHKLHTVKQNWYDALRFCQKGGAHLAVLNSSEERLALGKILKQRLQFETQTEDVAYIGIHDYCKPGSWINIFFDVLNDAEYLQWEEGSPNYVQTSEVPNCVAINRNGSLVNLSCSRKRPFFCEMET